MKSKFLKVLKFALKNVVPVVFAVEGMPAVATGAEKLAEALWRINGSEAPGDVEGVDPDALAVAAKDLINAVVAALNAIGALDDKPGFEVDFGKLVSSAIGLATAIAKLASLLKG